jgi:hypothetical protein
MIGGMTERLKPIWQWIIAATAILVLIVLFLPAIRARWIANHARDQLEEKYFSKRGFR